MSRITELQSHIVFISA